MKASAVQHEQASRGTMLRDPRWSTFVACLYSALATGCGYTFSIYSSALKKQFSLTQSSLDTINTVAFCSGLVAFIPGMLNDAKGPRVAVITGGMLQSSCFVLYWATARKLIPSLFGSPVAALSLYGAIAMLGSSCITSAVFATLTRNFPNQRGEVVGIAKAWVGLCGGVLAQLYTGFVGKPDDSAGTLNVVLVQALLMLAVTLLPSPAMTLQKQSVIDQLALNGIQKIIYMERISLICVFWVWLYRWAESEKSVRVQAEDRRVVTSQTFPFSFLRMFFLY